MDFTIDDERLTTENRLIKKIMEVINQLKGGNLFMLYFLTWYMLKMS